MRPIFRLAMAAVDASRSRTRGLQERRASDAAEGGGCIGKASKACLRKGGVSVPTREAMQRLCPNHPGPMSRGWPSGLLPVPEKSQLHTAVVPSPVNIHPDRLKLLNNICSASVPDI